MEDSSDLVITGHYPDVTLMELTTTEGNTPAGLPVFGYPGYIFWLIHSIAVASLGSSLFFSVGVLIYMLYPWRGFYNRPIGERLVVYLAFCDLFQSLSHILDHSYMMAVTDHPPDAVCAGFAFFLGLFTLEQAIIITFTALSAFCLVVLDKKIPTGKRDSGLLICAHGIPAIFVAVLAALGYLGPSGAWCFVDLRRSAGPLILTIYAACMASAFFFHVICYTGVWVKIIAISRNMSDVARVSDEAAEKRLRQRKQRTARALMCVVAAYICQWWALITQFLWGLVGPPPLAITCTVVFFSNIGGVLNCLAYTFVRRYGSQRGKKPSTNTLTTNITDSTSHVNSGEQLNKF